MPGDDVKLWLLRPKEGLHRLNDPWEPWYDKTFGFVVRAENADRAREIAQENAKEEKMFDIGTEIIKTWLDKRYSECWELPPEGDEEMIIEDHASA